MQNLLVLNHHAMIATTTTTENNVLETELQELFLIGKQRLSELDFLQCELEVLKKLFKKASFIISKGDFDKLSSLEKVHMRLKMRIQDYFHILEAMILNPKQKIDISLVDRYGQLADELEQVLKRLQQFKNNIFKHNKKHYITISE